jgi:hypothetical protein
MKETFFGIPVASGRNWSILRVRAQVGIEGATVVTLETPMTPSMCGLPSRFVLSIAFRDVAAASLLGDASIRGASPSDHSDAAVNGRGLKRSAGGLAVRSMSDQEPIEPFMQAPREALRAS